MTVSGYLTNDSEETAAITYRWTPPLSMQAKSGNGDDEK